MGSDDHFKRGGRAIPANGDRRRRGLFGRRRHRHRKKPAARDRISDLGVPQDRLARRTDELGHGNPQHAPHGLHRPHLRPPDFYRSLNRRIAGKSPLLRSAILWFFVGLY